MGSKSLKTREKSETIKGVWYAISAFILWGVLPLYWKALKAVPSSQILAHRILWSWIFVIVLIFIQRRSGEAKMLLSSWKNRLYFLFSAICIGINWFIYIWAVNAGHIVETSMGYFINPILNVLLGVLFLRERLKPLQAIAVFLAFGGVLSITIRYGKLPWIALSLAFSFGLYGFLRKTSRADSLLGLTFETAILSPLALAYLVYQGLLGNGAFGSVSAIEHILLICSGIVTATPLLWFAHGARRIPLSTLGFIQYLAPSFQLFIGVVVFREPFTMAHLLSFSLIWTALCIYSLSHTRLFQRLSTIKST